MEIKAQESPTFHCVLNVYSSQHVVWYYGNVNQEISKMFDGSVLLKLPTEWQEKTKTEFYTRLQICISDKQEAFKAACDTWNWLVVGNIDKQTFGSKLQAHLPDHVSLFLNGFHSMFRLWNLHNGFWISVKMF